MSNKNQLRKKFLNLRKKKYFEINRFFFKPLDLLIKKKFKNKAKINLSSFYPSSFEVNMMHLFYYKFRKKLKIVLPVILENYSMNFFNWNIFDTLKINKFGMLEPVLQTKSTVPDIMLIPLLAYDKNKSRLGYGKGFYDRYLNRYIKKNKKIITVGVAFSFQQAKKIPTDNYDVKLDYILNEKGIF